MKKNRFLKISFSLLLIPLGLSAAQGGEICYHGHVCYEYYDVIRRQSCKDNLADEKKQPREKSPLVIMVPGYTQYSASDEFGKLKCYFKKKKISYIIMNPPGHGEKTRCKSDRIFTWGKKEVGYLAELLSFLKCKLEKNHDEIHLLGFSLGARVVLEFSALEEKPLCPDSVTAVAAPYRIGDINYRVTGNIAHLFESSRSTGYAIKRAGFGNLVKMTFFGFFKGLIWNTALPAKKIPGINAPTLLIHSADDWLTKSYHSKKLFAYAGDNQRFALVILDTWIHAEDMLTERGKKIEGVFFSVLDKWYDYVKQTPADCTKAKFNKGFNKMLKTCDKTAKKIYNPKNVTLMSGPTHNNLNSNIWITPANHNHSVFTANCTSSLKGEKFSRYFFTLGPTAVRAPWWSQVRAGMSFEKQPGSNDLSGVELYGTLYAPFGFFIWLRRLTYIHGAGNTFNRRILSMDLSFFIIDFQINYGKFARRQPGIKDYLWQFSIDFPLIGDAAGGYFIGIGCGWFPCAVPGHLFKTSPKAYLFLGPTFKILGSRIRGHIQVEQDGWRIKGGRRVWSAGVSINVGER